MHVLGSSMGSVRGGGGSVRGASAPSQWICCSHVSESTWGLIGIVRMDGSWGGGGCCTAASSEPDAIDTWV